MVAHGRTTCIFKPDGGRAGQQQLLCLARVLLKRPAVVCLDECSSSVDPHTATMMQQVIHDQLMGCTTIQVCICPLPIPNGGLVESWSVLCCSGVIKLYDGPQVAHRLDSVMRSDRVVVMEGGRVIEQGQPQELLRDGASHFACMRRAQGGQSAAS